MHYTCFCSFIVTVEELQDVIFRKHVSLLETSISLIFLVCLTHLHVMRLAALPCSEVHVENITGILAS